MRDVSQYFVLIEKAVEYSGATEAEIEILRFDAKSGLIEGVLYFADGSRLEFTERVVIEQRRLVKQDRCKTLFAFMYFRRPAPTITVQKTSI